MLGRNVLLLSALPLLALQTGAAQTRSNKHPARPVGVVTVDAPLQEVLHGYLPWLERHPEAIPHAQPLIPEPSGVAVPRPQEAPVTPLVIRIPSIDLYSPSGVSVYHGTNSEKNAAFIRALPRSIRQAKAGKTSEVRPTLKEAVEMLDELKSYEAALLATKQYTVFALTFPGSVKSKAQDSAIQQLKRRARRIGVRVIEVRLHK